MTNPSIGEVLSEEISVREALTAALEMANVMEGLTGCRGDDDWVWGVQAKIQAALSCLSSQPPIEPVAGWRTDEQFGSAIYSDGKPLDEFDADPDEAGKNVSVGDEVAIERAYQAAVLALKGTSADIGVGELDKLVRSIVDALHEPNGQEPVGWIAHGDGRLILFTVHDFMRDEWIERGLEARPLYASPKPNTVPDVTDEHRSEILEEAARALDERGAREQENFGLSRATQNFYRARDLVRSLSTAPTTVMTVIDPDQWEPCSSTYLGAGGQCSAPRVWNSSECNHYHPKLTSALASEPK